MGLVMGLVMDLAMDLVSGTSGVKSKRSNSHSHVVIVVNGIATASLLDKVCGLIPTIRSSTN